MLSLQQIQELENLVERQASDLVFGPNGPNWPPPELSWPEAISRISSKDKILLFLLLSIDLLVVIGIVRMLVGLVTRLI